MRFILLHGNLVMQIALLAYSLTMGKEAGAQLKHTAALTLWWQLLSKRCREEIIYNSAQAAQRLAARAKREVIICSTFMHNNSPRSAGSALRRLSAASKGAVVIYAQVPRQLARQNGFFSPDFVDRDGEKEEKQKPQTEQKCDR